MSDERGDTNLKQTMFPVKRAYFLLEVVTENRTFEIDNIDENLKSKKGITGLVPQNIVDTECLQKQYRRT